MREIVRDALQRQWDFLDLLDLLDLDLRGARDGHLNVIHDG